MSYPDQYKKDKSFSSRVGLNNESIKWAGKKKKILPPDGQFKGLTFKKNKKKSKRLERVAGHHN